MTESARTWGTGTPVVSLVPERPRAGVVLISEVFGIDRVLRSYAERLVERGFAVSMPDLWWRHPERPPTSTREEIAAAVAVLADVDALKDVATASRMALADLPRTFVMGFCLGGLYARMAACAMFGFSGAVDFYGRIVYPAISPAKPVQPLDLLPGLGCPLQCHFGTEDTVAPPDHVDELEARLLLRPVATQVFRYPGCGHAFLNPERPTWNASAAKLAWARACTFLDALTEI